MKIRNPFLIKMTALVGAWLLRLYMMTVRFRYHHLGRNVDPRLGLKEQNIYALWHEDLLLPVYRFRGLGLCVLISQHADGQLITGVCRHLGTKVVRGSTTRGGAAAVRKLLRVARGRNSIVITVDGPRGPRRQVQQGLVFLASQTGFPIVPAAFGYSRAWRAKSWDRFAVPRPFSRVVCLTGEPMIIPPGLDRTHLEAYCQLVQAAMLPISDLADQLARTGKRPEPPAANKETPQPMRQAAG